MLTKSEKVRQYVREGDYARAMAIAKTFRFGVTKEQHEAMARAHECVCGNGTFYMQIGYDPIRLIDKGIQTVCELYGTGGKHDKAAKDRSLLETQGTMA